MMETDGSVRSVNAGAPALGLWGILTCDFGSDGMSLYELWKNCLLCKLLMPDKMFRADTEEELDAGLR